MVLTIGQGASCHSSMILIVGTACILIKALSNLWERDVLSWPDQLSLVSKRHSVGSRVDGYWYVVISYSSPQSLKTWLLYLLGSLDIKS
jgi:hypothetical protein